MKNFLIMLLLFSCKCFAQYQSKTIVVWGANDMYIKNLVTGDSERINHLPMLWGTFTGALSDQADLEAALNAKAALSHAHAYSSLTGLPTIPTTTSQLTNNSGYITGYTETDAVVKAINGIVKSNGTSISAAVAGTDYLTPSGSAASLTGFPTFNQNTSGTAASVSGTNVITNTHLAQIATAIFKGRTTAGTGNVEDLSVTQATALLNTVTSANKGLVPATGGSATNLFFNQAGTFTAPSGTAYRTLVTLASDVTNNNGTANTIADVTGLSFAVTAGTTYRFAALISYTSAATTTGCRFAMSGPASPTTISYTSSYVVTATTQTVNYASAYDIPAAANASSLTVGNIAKIEGIITPSASGTLVVRFASEVASSAIVAKAGSTIEIW